MVTTKAIKVGGPEYHEKAVVCDALIHSPIPVEGSKCKPEDRPCMIYFHGGGGVAGTPEQHEAICARYAVQCDAVIINVGYRLAPEH
jgi:acetyl esterase